jgi:preprotein translocase subunit YajC
MKKMARFMIVLVLVLVLILIIVFHCSRMERDSREKRPEVQVQNKPGAKVDVTLPAVLQ